MWSEGHKGVGRYCVTLCAVIVLDECWIWTCGHTGDARRRRIVAGGGRRTRAVALFLRELLRFLTRCLEAVRPVMASRFSRGKGARRARARRGVGCAPPFGFWGRRGGSVVEDGFGLPASASQSCPGARSTRPSDVSRRRQPSSPFHLLGHGRRWTTGEGLPCLGEDCCSICIRRPSMLSSFTSRSALSCLVSTPT